MNNNISFGANFIQKLPIKKYSYEKKIYTTDFANFVEFNPHDKNDVKALYEIARDFGGDTYAGNIYYDIKAASEKTVKDPNIRYFALTNQNGNFEDIEARNILGLTEIKKLNNKEIQIKYLQTHPQYLYSRGLPFIKRVGTAIINYFKLYNDKIHLISTPGVYLFYEKKGFRRISPHVYSMVWEKN